MAKHRAKLRRVRVARHFQRYHTRRGIVRHTVISYLRQPARKVSRRARIGQVVSREARLTWKAYFERFTNKEHRAFVKRMHRKFPWIPKKTLSARLATKKLMEQSERWAQGSFNYMEKEYTRKHKKPPKKKELEQIKLDLTEWFEEEGIEQFAPPGYK
jgi:hypothetical protein